MAGCQVPAKYSDIVSRKIKRSTTPALTFFHCFTAAPADSVPAILLTSVKQMLSVGTLRRWLPCSSTCPSELIVSLQFCSLLYKFLCRYSQALAALQQHLPFSEQDSEGVRTAFPWRDAFQGDKGFVSPAVQYERAAVVFNLGALSSQQPLNSDLNTDGGVKLAAKQFQVSALTDVQNTALCSESSSTKKNAL